MRRNCARKIVINLISLCATLVLLVGLTGCDSSENKGSVTTGGGSVNSAQNGSQDDFSKYIKDALETVGKDSNKQETAQPIEDKSQVIHISDDSEAVPMGEVSASDEAPVDNIFADGLSETDDSEVDSDAIPNDELLDSSSDYVDDSATPEDFEVGTSCIYIKGEIDSGYGADLIKSLNKVRTDLGYSELATNGGLSKCADRRTREITHTFGHTRPNGQAFYSLAPTYFKAEMLAIDNGTAEETVDAWIKDPISRSLVFNTKYTTVGAATLNCNGHYYSVLAFGY